jgi:DNA-binding beta-propeller fold protein YncE
MMHKMRASSFLLAGLLLTPHAAAAQVAVSANDGKAALVNGATTVAATPARDTVTILDLSVWPPRVAGEVAAPVSVVGPPQSVAIAPDRSIALVTSALKLDPADPSRTVPDDIVTVIDLRAAPPAAIATLHAGRQPSGVSINDTGTLALVANRADGTVSVFRIDGRTVTAAGTVDLGAKDSGPSHVVFTPDGRRALVARNTDSLISVLAIEGARVTYAKQDIAAGLKPYGLEVTPKGNVAIVANIGTGLAGGVDTLSVIDLASTPARAVNHVTVGPIPEGIAISPDGRHVAVTVMNGTNAPPASPLFHDFGLLKILRLDGTSLRPLTEAKIGRWCQGVAWHPDGRSLLVQCMIEREIRTFRFDGTRLTPGAAVPVPAGPAGIRARH